MAWVWGKPCRRSRGGPEPPCRRRMVTSSVSTVVSVNPSNTTPSWKALPRGDDLEASRDAFSFVIHHGQYVLAGIDVQRLLVKSVRFPQVLTVEMPIDRGLATAGNRLENRATALAIEFLRDQHLRVRIRIQQCERGAAFGARGVAVGAHRRQRPVFGVHSTKVEL